MPKRITADEFADKVNKVFNGRIVIVKETFSGTHNKVTAFCNKHKIYFDVCEARYLIRKKKRANCPECFKEQQKINGQKKIKSWLLVLKTFKYKYKNKFSYDESSYKGMNEEMIIHCNDCGKTFQLSPTHHLKYNNGGCPNCSKYKIIKCSKCGKEIKVNKHENGHILCEKCKSEQKYTKNNRIKRGYVKCKICGTIYKRNETCPNNICSRFHTVNTLRILIPFGFNNQTIGTLECLDEIEKSSKLLLSEYFDNKLSARLIFEKYNCEKYFKSEWYIRYFIKTKFDINLRTTSEAVTNAIELGLYDNINIKQNQYKVETHTTWDYKTITLRSSYEIDYASELDELKISYDYEILRIHYFDTQLNRERIAIPDFYLIDTNTIVEVKSSWTLDKQNMLDKRKAYLELGYNFKLWYEHEYVELDDLEFNDNNIDNYR